MTHRHGHEVRNEQQDGPDDGDAVDHGGALPVEDAPLELHRVRVEEVDVDEEGEAELAKEGDGRKEPPHLVGECGWGECGWGEWGA